MDAFELIKHNIKMHNEFYDKYEQMHDEIFNPIEQKRIHKQLKYAITLIKTSSPNKIALDYGCGTGNLTRHLIDLSVYVISADVADNFLVHLKESESAIDRLQVLKINGQDLSNIENNKFDLVATYSVLHHIPDYLRIIEEFIRVTKDGGIIYLDHEVNENFWNRCKDYEDFLHNARGGKLKQYLNWRTVSNLPKYIARKANLIERNKYTCEGDIHIYQEDHIEWDKIKNLLSRQNCKIVLERDYLLYRTQYPLHIYERYKERVSDYRVLIARKNPD